MLLASSSSEVSLVGPPSGAVGRRVGGQGGKWAREMCLGRAAGLRLPTPEPLATHTHTDACPLAVSVAAVRPAHLLGFDRWLHAGDSAGRDVVWGGLALGASALTHHQAAAKWFELMTLIQTGQGGKWKH